MGAGVRIRLKIRQMAAASVITAVCLTMLPSCASAPRATPPPTSPSKIQPAPAPSRTQETKIASLIDFRDGGELPSEARVRGIAYSRLLPPDSTLWIALRVKTESNPNGISYLQSPVVITQVSQAPVLEWQGSIGRLPTGLILTSRVAEIQVLVANEVASGELRKLWESSKEPKTFPPDFRGVTIADTRSLTIRNSP